MENLGQEPVDVRQAVDLGLRHPPLVGYGPDQGPGQGPGQGRGPRHPCDNIEGVI